MVIVLVFAVALLAATILIHYEVLRLLNACLPQLSIPNRTKLLLVIFASFVAHVLEMTIYGFGYFALIEYCNVGTLEGTAEFSLANCLYFSTQTYTSLGFGDIAPQGSIRILVGVEALNGLLLIGWSASYTYLAMERFWDSK